MRLLLEEKRLKVHGRETAARRDDFASAVRRGLSASPKELPCRFFYDAQGSRLFDEICEQPEYYPTRAETEILERHAEEIIASAGEGLELVELGSGSGLKTRILIEALLGAQRRLTYVPVDISCTALEASARELLEDHPGLVVHALAGEYREGLAELAKTPDRPRLILWLGSSVGNFSRAAAADLLREMRSSKGPEDRLLLGVDLRKGRAELERAYDDAAGVTAAFNLNLLARINRELGGHFDLQSFQHRALYLEEKGRIEMHLVSLRAQTVAIDALELEVPFTAGETIHTENSVKYSFAEIDELAHCSGMQVLRRWTDSAGRFGESLLS